VSRYLTRQEAVAAVLRGQPVAQLLRYVRGAGGSPSTFTCVYVASTPRSDVVARRATYEDVGDGVEADLSWFPEVDEWESEVDADGALLNGPDLGERRFPNADEAFQTLRVDLGTNDERWRHESMIDEEYLSARRTALTAP
jgi:hypothetical protein